MAQRLDEQAVRHVARLARLNLTADEVARFAEQLTEILAYVEKLNELDTKGVPPTAHPFEIGNVLRDDEIRPGLDAEHAFANAPARHGDFFRVPKVLEQEEA